MKDRQAPSEGKTGEDRRFLKIGKAGGGARGGGKRLERVFKKTVGRGKRNLGCGGTEGCD